MKTEEITATDQEIHLTFDAAYEKRVRVSVFSPAIGEEGELVSVGMHLSGSTLTLSRYLSGRDGLTMCYSVADAGGVIDGAKYVTERPSVLSLLTPDPTEIYVYMPSLLREYPLGADTLFYRFEHRDYFFRKSQVEALDALVAEHEPATLRLANAIPEDTRLRAAFWGRIAHPSAAEEPISPFNTVREDGCVYYRAFVSFLAARYAGGRVGAWVIDPGTAEARFGEEYAAALRIAYQYTAPSGAAVRMPEDTDAALAAAARSYLARDGAIPGL